MRDGALKLFFQMFIGKLFVLVKYLSLFIIFILMILWFLTMLPNALRYSNYEDRIKVDAIVVPSGGSGERVQTAVSYYLKHGNPKVIMSGEPILGTTVPKLMKDYAVKLSANPYDILLETNSYATKDHPVNVRPILKRYGIKSILLVTSDYHTRRTYETFKRYFDDNDIDCELYIVEAETSLYRDRDDYYWKDHELLSVVLQESLKSAYYMLFVR